MSSKLPSVLAATDEEIQLLLAAQSHIGTKNVDKQMEPYVWKRRADGTSPSASPANHVNVTIEIPTYFAS